MLLQNMLRTMGAAADDKLMVEDVFNTTLYSGTGAGLSVNTGINLWDIEVAELIRLQALDAAANDYFGYSVAMSSDGNTLAVGSYYDDNSGGADAGSVYIFTRSGTTWTQQTRVQASDAAASDRFGQSVAISSDGNTLAVGARFDDNSGGGDAGSAYIFTRSGTTWTQQTRLQASDAAASDRFGQSVAISSDGNTLAVGSYFDDNSGGADAGSVYIFTRSGTVWSEQTRIQASDAAASDLFGFSVALSSDGNTLAVGAYADDSGGADAGSVYIFTRSGTVWSEQTRLQASDASASDRFGQSVAVSADGNTLAVGSYYDDNSGGADAGSVYIFTRSGTTWTQQTKVQASDAAASDYFGYSVALSSDGNTLAVGAYADDNSGGANAGSVYIFTRSGTTWTQQTKVQASDAAASDQFGYSVAISSDGNTLAVGSYFDDNSGGADAGSVYTYSITASNNAGMIWLKSRSAATDHAIYDTVRGATYDIASNTTAAQTTQATGVTGFGATGFSMGALAKINTNAATYAAWTFKKAPKFFDVVTYTGDGVAGREIAHGLGCVPGMVIVKRTDVASDWIVWHRSIANTEFVKLNSTAAKATGSYWNSTTPTATTVILGNDAAVNSSGGTYTLYLFGHEE